MLDQKASLFDRAVRVGPSTIRQTCAAVCARLFRVLSVAIGRSALPIASLLARPGLRDSRFDRSDDVFAYGTDGLFPTNRCNSTSYGVDVVLRPQLAE